MEHTTPKPFSIQMAQTGVHLASVVQDKMLSHHQPQPQQQSQGINNNLVASQAKTGRLKPNLPRLYLFREGSRENYLKEGVPLYEASIRCDWVAAKAILDKKPDLVRYSITENGETALHVAASAKGDPKDVEEFVKNLVRKMKEEDLALENENFNTALYLAAAAGNVKAVKIMVEKNSILPTIPGAQGKMLPLYAAALFGNYDVVKYLYEESKELSDDCWNPQNRGWLLEKCVENDMFDVALNIIKRYPELGRGSALRVLARKPEAFRETKSTIKSAFSFIGLKVGVPEKESTALTLLRFIWKDIAKKPKKEIDEILRGPPDSIERDNKTVSGLAIQAMQLRKLIYEHLSKMEEESKNILTRSSDSTNQSTKRASVEEEQAVQLQNLISEHLMKMHAETQKITIGPLNSIKQEYIPVSSKGDMALKLQNLIFEHIASMHDKTQNIIETTKLEGQALGLKQVISEQIKKMDTETQKIIREPRPAKQTYSSRVLFIAAEMGNTSFLVELIRQYPDLIWKVNDDKQSIFHIAVKHRHEGIYNLLYEIGAMKDLITPLKDLNDNNMLHLVGKIAKQKRLNDVSGVALQMQRELLWFQEVREMIPPSYRERVNKDGLTPHELFTMEHKELVSQGEKWMKGTASQCMVVAALIATIVFAAAFTVPGGYDQNNGVPLFHSKATFMVFVVADAISLFASSASILIFLSILTSRYAESDFLDSLPEKLISGLLTLFLSIITMTVAFGVSFFILYNKGLLWMPVLICVFAVFPVLLYLWLQCGLFFDVIRSTYISRYIFKPKKQVLYYKNPNV
ncbi:putative ankyrin repeat-containing domain, PGG domain, ankyrin repeat-containing domain superfamily [Helianthus debilis subsp. tardiflorus]